MGERLGGEVEIGDGGTFLPFQRGNKDIANTLGSHKDLEIDIGSSSSDE